MVGDSDDAVIYNYLASGLQHTVEQVQQAYSTAPRNVRTVLRRQILNAVKPTASHPLCSLLDEKRLVKVLGTLPLGQALFTLARIYDAAHVALCKTITAAQKGKPHNEFFRANRRIDLQEFTHQLSQDKTVVEDEIFLQADLDKGKPLRAIWKPLPPMTFDKLPVLDSLSRLLPGEQPLSRPPSQPPSRQYAGIGGGGGSDIISASLLGHLLRQHDKEMNLLISTRTWATGSQGKQGSKLGVKREVYNHGGGVRAHGRPVAGTFLVRGDTYAEGRTLEAIPILNHLQIFMVLDQGESTSDIPESDKADLRDQLHAVLDQAKSPIDTVLIIDTGGDVFGADTSGATTPDQDFRVQRAMSSLSSSYDLVTAVMSPGVDAPIDAPQKAFEAGGMVYKLSQEEKSMLLDLLVNRYKMDGSDPSRFGKTTLALQARLRGVVGWTSLDLPEHVVDTWENPWTGFVYIRDCMSDIIFMPTTKLLPLIEPKSY
jgi:hypothetical protein